LGAVKLEHLVADKKYFQLFCTSQNLAMNK